MDELGFQDESFPNFDEKKEARRGARVIWYGALFAVIAISLILTYIFL